jgi:hypothetical protein
MPIHARTPDYLRNHITLEHRVTNLETGVHPTTADVDYFDSTPWTEIIVTNSNLTYATTGLIQERPYWRKRVGMIALRGAIEPKGGIGGHWPTSPPEGVLFSTLPKNARPGVTLRMRITVRETPWAGTLEVRDNGEMRIIYEPWTPSAGGVQARFDGVMWVPDDG